MVTALNSRRNAGNAEGKSALVRLIVRHQVRIFYLSIKAVNLRDFIADKDEKVVED